MVLSPGEAEAQRDAERAAPRVRMSEVMKQAEEQQTQSAPGPLSPSPASGEPPDMAKLARSQSLSTSTPLPQFSPDSPPKLPLPPLPESVLSPYHGRTNGKPATFDDVFDPKRPPRIPLPPVPPLVPSASAPVGLGLLASDPKFEPTETEKAPDRDRRSSLPYIHERGHSSASSKSSLDLDSMVRTPLPRRRRDPAVIAFPPSSDEDDQDSEIDLDSSLHIAALRSGVKDDVSSEGEGNSRDKVKCLDTPVSWAGITETAAISP
jgi:hypothetical protein